jgi:hypothetical protein
MIGVLSKAQFPIILLYMSETTIQMFSLNMLNNEVSHRPPWSNQQKSIGFLKERKPFNRHKRKCAENLVCLPLFSSSAKPPEHKKQRRGQQTKIKIDNLTLEYFKERQKIYSKETTKLLTRATFP